MQAVNGVHIGGIWHMLLPQIDCCQAVCAENEGEFTAVMNVVFEHMPDNILARTCGTLFAVRWEDMLKIGRSPASKRILDQLPGPLKPGNQLCLRA